MRAEVHNSDNYSHQVKPIRLFYMQELCCQDLFEAGATPFAGRCRKNDSLDGQRLWKFSVRARKKKCVRFRSVALSIKTTMLKRASRRGSQVV